MIDDDPLKLCSKCEKNLPVRDFSPSSGGVYLRPECRKCARKLSKERKALRATTPPPAKDHQCPGCLRNEREAQGCGGKKLGTWCLDHHHENGLARDWLCHDCNRKIGDDPQELFRLANYLLKWEKIYYDTL
jgi:hypothetical protein